MTARTADVDASAASDLTPVRIHDLGSMVIEAQEATTVRWRKPAQILGTLLVTPNRRVSMDTLVTVVWGEQANGSAESTLMSHVWRLRKLMEPQRSRRDDPTHLVNDRGGYRLVVNAEHADSLRFAELASQGDLLLAAGSPDRALPRYQEALDLWRGRPFEAIADTEWATAAVARLEELHSQVNEQLVESLLRTGAPEMAVQLLEELIARLPLRDRLWRQLMLGLYQMGRIEEALNTYRRARASLLDNLGVDPSPELRDLQQRILAQDPTLQRPTIPETIVLPPDPETVAEIRESPISPARTPRPGTHQPQLHLPTLRSPLVGRDVELARLTRVLDHSQLVTVVGAGGAGKTRLAIEVARKAAGTAPDGVWFVDLAALDDPDLVPETVLSTIGIAEATTGTPLSLLRSYVRDRQVLLVIDNCEHLLTAVRTLLDAVLAEDSHARVLATSREPISTDGEVLWTLAPLAVIGDASLDPHRSSPAAAMFVSKARSVDATFDPDAAAMADIESICAAVDGIPLAIELAAGRIRSASLSEVREQVTTALGALARIGHTRTEHHRTVDLSIDWSVQLLDDGERVAHLRLAALPGIFTVDAAHAVLDTSGGPMRTTAELLSRLVHRSLLSVVPGAAPGEPTRFRQLATVRAHALTTLVRGGDRHDVLARRRRWIEELMAARPDFDGPDDDNWYPRVAHDHDTLTAVLHDTLVEQPDPVGTHILGELANYWTYQRRMAEGERWCQIALQQQQGTARDRTLVELQLACSFAYRNRSDLALPLVRSVITRSADCDPREYAHFLATTAWCGYLRGDTALNFVEDEVQRIADDDPMIRLWADLLAGKTLLAADQPQTALAHARALVARAAHAGNVAVAWLASSLSASSALLLRDPDTSSAWLQRGVDYQRRSGNARDVGLLEFQANLQVLSGNHRAAVQLFGQSSALTFREGSPWPTRQWTESSLAQVRKTLTVDEFDTAWQQGVARAATAGDALPPQSEREISTFAGQDGTAGAAPRPDWPGAARPRL